MDCQIEQTDHPMRQKALLPESDRFHKSPHFFGTVREISEAQYMDISNTFMVSQYRV
jgi:hypothetical protein